MLSDETVDSLTLLARGDMDLVNEALIHCLEQRWSWRHLANVWQIDMIKVTEYIMQRRKKLEDIKEADEP